MKIREKINLIYMCIALLSSPGISSVESQIIYVDQDAPGANNGISWEHAFNYLQDALTQAQLGDSIYVAEGIYLPNHITSPQAKGRDATFLLSQDITLEGGYAGYGTSNPSERNISLYETILSGDLNNNDAIIEINDVNLIDNLLDDATRQDNCYSVVSAYNATSSAVLDGFTISGGNANGSPEQQYQTHGAGIYLHEGNVTIQRCLFKANAALEDGGALHARYSHPIVNDCTFISNYSEKYAGALSLTDVNAKITFCRFINNWAGDAGGAIHNEYGKSDIVDCTFTENWGTHYGGAMYNYYSDANISRCNYIKNSSGSKGGAVYNNFSSAYNQQSPLYSNCQFIDNETLMSGGAVQNSWCNALLINCIFSGNISASDGGAVYNNHSEPVYVNCLFQNNHADIAGGAMCNLDTNVKVINCTFFANTATQGHAIASTDTTITHSQIQVSNSILWDEGHEMTKNNPVTQYLVTYSNIYGSYQGQGNIYSDPQFISPSNLRLANISPCIDAAENYAVPVEIDTDLDGKPRFLDDPATLDTGNGKSPTVDMGAYEFNLYDPNNAIQCGPTPPIAHAGSNQAVHAGIDGQAMITLDGSDSFDPDGDALFYSWTWIIDNHVYHDGGLNPTIQCPVGEHMMELIVSDCANISMPAYTMITIIKPLQAPVWLHPYPIKRDDPKQEHVLAMMYIDNKTENQIDLTYPLTIYPGEIQANSQYAYESHEGGLMTTVIGMFDKHQVLSAFTTNGLQEVTVAGRLLTDQVFFGTDEIWIID